MIGLIINLGTVLWTLFSAICDNFRQKKFAFFLKTMVWSNCCMNEVCRMRYESKTRIFAKFFTIFFKIITLVPDQRSMPNITNFCYLSFLPPFFWPIRFQLVPTYVFIASEFTNLNQNLAVAFGKKRDWLWMPQRFRISLPNEMMCFANRDRCYDF
jgi:hypothetical protein